MRLSIQLLLSLAMLATPCVLAACDDGEVIPAPTSDKNADDDGVLGEEDPSSGGNTSTDSGSGTTDASSGETDSGSETPDAGPADASDGG